jgi:hypothetical protein
MPELEKMRLCVTRKNEEFGEIQDHEDSETYDFILVQSKKKKTR